MKRVRLQTVRVPRLTLQEWRAMLDILEKRVAWLPAEGYDDVRNATAKIREYVKLRDTEAHAEG